MALEFPAEFRPKHVDAFLRKIKDDRDRELAAIASKLEVEVAAIRRQAHAQARQLARRVIAETREQVRRQRDRYLYKVRSQLIRSQWEILEQARQRIRAAVDHRLQATWKAPARQADWCRFWVEAAKRLGAPHDLHVRCGAGTLDASVSDLERQASGYPGRLAVEVDPSLPAGLLVDWQDHCLDGTLPGHRDAIVQQVLARVAEIVSDGAHRS